MDERLSSVSQAPMEIVRRRRAPVQKALSPYRTVTGGRREDPDDHDVAASRASVVLSLAELEARGRLIES